MIERVHDPNKRRGLIWHTQGSGKNPHHDNRCFPVSCRGGTETEKPTVLMLIDRNELESQLFKNITGYGITALEVARSKRGPAADFSVRLSWLNCLNDP